MLRCIPLIVVCLACAGAQAADLPAPPKALGSLVDTLDYGSARAAKLWEPMAGTADVSVVRIRGRRVLRMPCDFAGTRIERASWDRHIELDLAVCRGLRFDFYCADASPVSRFNVFFHSGNGWYTAGFGATSSSEWQAIEIEKDQTRVEGTPAGWGCVDAIRISAWRGKDIDTTFYIANLAVLGGDAPIVVVRGDSAATHAPDEMKAAGQFARLVGRCLTDVSIPYSMMSELDVTAGRLAGRKLVILPHNPRMPPDVVEKLVAYVEGGGKLICFFTSARPLVDAVGMKLGAFTKAAGGRFASIRRTGDALPGMRDTIRQGTWNIRIVEPIEGRSRLAATWNDAEGNDTKYPAIVVSDSAICMTHVLLEDDWPGKQRLMLAMVGRLLPNEWRAACTRQIDRIGWFGPYEGFKDACRQIAASAVAGDRPGTEVTAALTEARRCRDRAEKEIEAGRFGKATDEIQEARALLIRGHCLAQRPLAGEYRAFWCHSAFGLPGRDWDEAIGILAANGFTAILPNMSWGGTAFYPSEVLPEYAELAAKGDQIALCQAACRKHGVDCHVWKVNWNMGRRAPESFAKEMKAAGRTQVDYRGRSLERWLCPSHPDNQKLEIDAMTEIVRNYDVAGIHFDYIRYPGPECCFCDGCRKRFEKAIGRKIARWPADVREDERLARQWQDFRCRQITTVVAAVAEQARKIRPGVEISAAVFRRQPRDALGVGQDWRFWCEKGYLDFVCPMDYTPSNAEFEGHVMHQLEQAGEVPIYPGIGLSVWPDRTDIVKLIEQIDITRKLETGGFTIFQYGDTQARDVVPLCGLGITKPTK